MNPHAGEPMVSKKAGFSVTTIVLAIIAVIVVLVILREAFLSA